jgi:hypothetical protein
MIPLQVSVAMTYNEGLIFAAAAVAAVVFVLLARRYRQRRGWWLRLMVVGVLLQFFAQAIPAVLTIALSWMISTSSSGPQAAYDDRVATAGLISSILVPSERIAGLAGLICIVLGAFLATQQGPSQLVRGLGSAWTRFLRWASFGPTSQ